MKIIVATGLAHQLVNVKRLEEYFYPVLHRFLEGNSVYF